MDKLSKASITNGIILGIVLIIQSVLIYVVGLGASLWFFFINALIMIAVYTVGLFLATKNVRDKILNGVMPYGKAVLISFLIGIIALIVSSVYSWVFLAYIDPDYSVEMVEGIADQLEQIPNMPTEKIDEMYEQIEEVRSQSPFEQMFNSLKSSFFFMLVIALIVSLFVRKKESIFSETEE